MQGVILSGGPDLHPRCYGEEPLGGLGEVDAALDETELSIAQLALDKDLPLLGICRGIQVLNVALGGTLYQDIPSQLPAAICHTPRTDKAVNTHTVQFEADSMLHRIFGEPEIWVNSQHHSSQGSSGTPRAPGARTPSRRSFSGRSWTPRAEAAAARPQSTAQFLHERPQLSLRLEMGSSKLIAGARVHFLPSTVPPCTDPV